ncbi:MAG: DMT family transporter [Nitrospira sp.]|nr:DMT family transporter [Nitrospira sp.]
MTGRLLRMIVTGGILGPLCMLWSLQRLSGVLGSLLLNLEAPATIGLAVLWCGEHLGRREVAGALLIVSAATFLHYRPQEMYPDTWGVVAMIGACVCWGIDNLSQKYPCGTPSWSRESKAEQDSAH